MADTNTTHRNVILFQPLAARLKPSIWIELIGIFAEDFLVVVNNPRINAELGLFELVCNTSLIGHGISYSWSKIMATNGDALRRRNSAKAKRHRRMYSPCFFQLDGRKS